jgi:hypothetical protein
MFRRFEGDPDDLPSVSRSSPYRARIGYLRSNKRLIIPLAVAAGLLTGLFTVGAIERCDPKFGKWLPSLFSDAACHCDELLLEDGSPLLTETGDPICIDNSR